MNEKITLVKDTIDKEDVDNLIEWLKTYPRLTMGPKTREYEEKFSEWLGCKYSVFVNSGSSANLLMLYALKIIGNLRNEKIVVPALAWATDMAPVIQLGFEPLICDCNMQNLAVDVGQLESIFKYHKPAALILVSVLGLSPDMDKIVKLCQKYGVILLEDNCESQGTEFQGKKLGNFGLMSSFSSYFGHTMSTIEGGMVCTNDKDVYNLIKMLRSHGWDRDLDEESQKKLRNKWGVDDFSALYTFYEPGFNLRSTDLQAVIGIGQLDKIDDMIDARNENFYHFLDVMKSYDKKSKVWRPTEHKESFTASFCYPMIFKTKEDKEKAVAALVENNIETRPLICGSMGTQPFVISRYGRHETLNAAAVDECGIYVPNHPELSNSDIELICKTVIEAIK
ncbi:MAG: DegT/DnrJ/EryC1/StrS family aminotransferase [Nanoarchaeota archaeon]